MCDEARFRPGQVWRDTDGRPIQAHGGGMLYEDGLYYWFGEDKTAETQKARVDVRGVHCYSSRDLLHWQDEGLVLRAVPDDPGHDLHPSKVVERPKVIYNHVTRQYVMWMHIDTGDYQTARAGVAVSDRPTGPYEYLGSVRPNGKDSRDMTLFQDEDGKAYLIHSSDWNSVLLFSELSDDYLQPTGKYSRQFDHGTGNSGRESPALFRHEDKYFLITSGCTGWNPNEAEYAVADAVHGPWRVKGNPCQGPDNEKTFFSQDTYVLPVAGRPGAFIFMADRWNPGNLGDSRYVWLPLTVHGEEVSVVWRDEWDLTVFA